MVDAAKVQSFADRVLALKAQEDEIKKEIREVYAEAVEDEIDKTGLGQLVTHLRKRGKAPEDFDAKEAIFLGYLELYNVALARTHAYARARTGEIIENTEPAPTAPQLSAADAESQPLGTAEELQPGSSAPIQPETANQVPATTNGGSDGRSAHPESDPVKLDRRRHHNDDEPKDTHHDMGASPRPVNASEEPGRSLASDTPPKPVNDDFARIQVIGSIR